MLSLAWLTVFIIFVYVPGSTLNVIERSSSSLLLLSKSDSEATKLDKSSVALVGSSSLSLMPGDDDYAKEKLIFRRTNNNKTEEGEIIELNDITAASAPITRNTTTTTILGGKYHHHQQQHQHQEHQRESLKKEQVSDNAHSVITKDPSASSPSSLLLSSSSLLNIELTQATTSTTDTPTTTKTTTISARTTTTTTKTPPPPSQTTAIRTWNNLNDFGNSKNNNGRRSSKSIYGQHEPTPTPTPQPPLLPPPAAQQQNRQHLQLALLSASSSLSSSSSGGTHQQSLLNPIPVAIPRNTTTVLPLQLTQSIQNTASVIIRGNSLNWGYVELASSDSPSPSSPPFSISSSTPRTAELPGAVVVPTQLPHQLSSTTSSAAGSSFVLSLSPGSSSFLYSSELPLMSSSSSTLASSSLSPLSPTTTSLSSSMSSLSTTSTARTTTSTTTPKSPSLSSTDGYLNITSQAGTHAYLPCNVKQLVKKPISWLRVRDGHILTVDQTTFIADQRFQSIYTPNPERWSLQIKYVQTKDAGTYECQVSTEPKTSAIVSLNIVEPKTELIGESNRHVKAGSQVKLRCIISQALEPPLYINWYHNRQQIFLHNRKGWRTEIERDVAVSGTTATGSSSSSSSSLSSSNSNNNNNIGQDKQSTTIASLIIPSVGKKDSGNYTCSPSNSEPITVVLHVLNGEYSASAITSGSARSNSIKDIQGLLHLIPWVISLVMCFGQMIYFYDVSRLLLLLSSSQLRRRTTSLTAERN